MEDSCAVLCITDTITPDKQGGSGRVAWELSKSLLGRGHRITILTRGGKGQPEEELIDGISIHRFFDNPLTGRRIFKKLTKTFNPDVILVNQPFSGISALGLSAKTDIPLVYIFHSPWVEEYEIRTHDLGRSSLRAKAGMWARKRAEAKLLNSASAIVTLSEYMVSRLQHWYQIPDDKITVVPGGVDLNRFNANGTREEARAQVGLPTHRSIILTVRNLVSRMGLEALVGAMRTVVDSRPDTLLVIGGRGYLKNKLQALAVENGMQNNVLLTGFIDDEVLPRYYRAADLFVLPTRLLEGFGLVTLEALACGTPVLGTPVGGTVEILNKLDEGFIFPSSEQNDIALGIRDFFQRSDDPGDLERRCRTFVEERYSWEKFAAGIEGVLHEAGILPGA